MFLTPLRYPGGKAQYIPIVENYANLCPHSRYVEPFAGGAAIALHFAINRCTHVVINDKDPAIYAFWRSIMRDAKAFVERIRATPVDMENWYQCKKIMLDARNQSDFDLGFAMFFLNRCNYSGGLKANPIGGVQQRGKWRMDARFNKAELIRRIQVIAKHKRRIRVTNDDAVDLVRKKIREHDFLYLDPPYYTQGKKLYSNYLSQDGHDRLAQELGKTSANWLMSYDNNPYIKTLYRNKLLCKKAVRYSFLRKRKTQELLISSMS